MNRGFHTTRRIFVGAAGAAIVGRTVEATAVAREAGQRDEEIARVCHEAYRAYFLAHAQHLEIVREHLPPEHVLAAWDDVPQEFRDEIQMDVAFLLANPEWDPRRHHQKWVEQMEKDGWKYGPVWDFAAKEHPHIRPFGSLYAKARVRDFIFKAIVNAMAGEG